MYLPQNLTKDIDHLHDLKIAFLKNLGFSVQDRQLIRRGVSLKLNNRI